VLMQALNPFAGLDFVSPSPMVRLSARRHLTPRLRLAWVTQPVPDATLEIDALEGNIPLVNTLLE